MLPDAPGISKAFGPYCLCILYIVNIYIVYAVENNVLSC